MNKIIITGASGMIGSHLTNVCLANGTEVIAVVRKGSKKIDNIPNDAHVRIVECDLNEITRLPDIISGKYDAFYHFAWDGVFGNDRNNVGKQVDNIDNSISAVEAAAKLGCNKFIFAGSQAEYGLKNCKLSVNTVAEPITPYGIAKYTVNKLGAIRALDLGMEFCSGRILSAYGPRDNSYTMIMTLIDKLIKGESVDLTTGDQIWDYVYAKDAANAFYLMGINGVHGKAYPIASGESKPLKEFVREIYGIVGNDRAILNFGAIQLGDNAVKHLAADLSELTSDTGYVTQYSFIDGIRETIDWVKSR